MLGPSAHVRREVTSRAAHRACVRTYVSQNIYVFLYGVAGVGDRAARSWGSRGVPGRGAGQGGSERRGRWTRAGGVLTSVFARAWTWTRTGSLYTHVRVHAPHRTLWLPVLARAGRGEAGGGRQSEKKAEMDTLCPRGDKEGFAMGGAGRRREGGEGTRRARSGRQRCVRVGGNGNGRKRRKAMARRVARPSAGQGRLATRGQI